MATYVVSTIPNYSNVLAHVEKCYLKICDVNVQYLNSLYCILRDDVMWRLRL